MSRAGLFVLTMLVVALALLWPNHPKIAEAHGVLDQRWEPTTTFPPCPCQGGEYQILYHEPIGQEFVPSATTLAAVEVMLVNQTPHGDTAPVTMNVRGGAIDGPILATVTLEVGGPGPGEAAQAPFWVDFHLASSIGVTPGNKYVIELQSVNLIHLLSGSMDTSGGYLPGRGLIFGNTELQIDFNFRTYAAAGPADNYKLSVSDFKQCDLPWGDDLYDSINLYVSGRTDVCWWGCALTSAVDVLTYWGVSTTPDALNGWLNEHSGYHEGYVDWSKVVEYAEQLGVDLGRPKLYRDTDLAGLRASLDSGHPVILGVPFGGKNPGHWVVAIGPNGDTWWINDPGGVGAVTLEAYGNTFSRRLVFEPDTGNNARLVVRARSPVEFVITDPQGRRLGFDPNSGTSYAEIAGASYGLDGAIVGGDGSGEMLPGAKTAWLNAPIDGEYTIDAIGTGTGTYAIDGEAYDRYGNDSHIEGPAGTTSPGQVDSTAIYYTSQVAPVGGIAELPGVSDSSAPGYIALAGLAGVALFALTATAWCARRRWLG